MSQRPPSEAPQGTHRVTKTELVWPGKYDEHGNLREVPRVSLPFQVVETINESRATREAKHERTLSLFDVYEGTEGDTVDEGWRNKLIWGENLLAMGSLLERFAGQVDLIYIDPPFATGADFSFAAAVGDAGEGVYKEQSVIEEKAYRDTWGGGIGTYLQMLAERLALMRDILAESGCLFVHLDWHVSHPVKLVLDELFGVSCFMNEISWKRYAAHSLSTKRFDTITDRLLFYVKNPNEYQFTLQYEQVDDEEVERRFPYVETETGRRFQHVALEQSSNASSRGEERVIQGRRATSSIGWRWTQQTFDERLAENPHLIYWTAAGRPRYKIYADGYEGRPLGDLWVDIPYLSAGDSERVDYATQKPERLLQRVIEAGSNKGGLVADFFCGSGTTLSVAEKLGRRWIGCDLSRWAVHTTRKRLLGIEGCRPFEVLNLGKYERKYWQGVTFGERQGNDEQLALYQYLSFILRLYGAEPLAGMQHIHGKKGKALVHIGAVDAPVTIGEINDCIEECLAVKQTEIHILAWEWEMGLANPMVQEARRSGVKLMLLNIDPQVMQQQAVDKGDVRFFEVAHLDVEIVTPKRREARVKLSDFSFPYADLIPEDVRGKIRQWSDFIDYWAVDWDFQNDTFINGWVAYRTRRDRTLPLQSDTHSYDAPGTYRVMVKVVDIFGNDTSQVFEVEVK